MITILEGMQELEVTDEQAQALLEADLIYFDDEEPFARLVAPDGWFIGEELDQAFERIEAFIRGWNE